MTGGADLPLATEASLDISGDSHGHKRKGGFKMPTLEGTIDLRPHSGHIGLDADISPTPSRTNTLKGDGGIIS